MYGYIVPQRSVLGASDHVLYRAFYCGLCCQLGKLYGQLPRFTTNYDFAFLSVLLHDVAQADIVIEERGCVLNAVTKKAILQPNPLLERLAAANIILSYQKADDGVIDRDGLKYKAARRVLKKPFEKAKTQCPEIYDAVAAFCKKQRAVEESGVASVDRAADPFASLLRDLPELILGGKTDDNLKGLCYNVGKFVYLADALDDITEDFKRKRYNPFLAAYGGFEDRKSFIAAHRDDLDFCFKSCYMRAMQCLGDMRLTQSYGLIKNVVCDGMPSKTQELLDSVTKLRSPRI